MSDDKHSQFSTLKSLLIPTLPIDSPSETLLRLSGAEIS